MDKKENGESIKLLHSELQEAVKTLQKVADTLNSTATLLSTRNSMVPQTSFASNGDDFSTALSSSNLSLNLGAGDNNTSKKTGQVSEDRPALPSTSSFYYGHVLIRKLSGNVQEIPELRVCVVGNVDAGKSTLLGVLTKDNLDDGRGKARVSLFRHKHEIETGRTSSIGMELMGFDAKGDVVTPKSLGKTKLAWDDVCMNASKVRDCLDLGEGNTLVWTKKNYINKKRLLRLLIWRDMKSISRPRCLE
jgi:hypothetical protein